MKRVLAGALLLVGVLGSTGASAPESDEEVIARLEKQADSLRHEIQGLKTRLKRSRGQVAKKLAPLIRNDTGFKSQGITDAGYAYSWASKHAGKKLRGTVEQPAGAPGATLTSRSK